MTDTVLSAEQVESFVEDGYVRIAECFTREDAQGRLDEAWVRLGYDRDDPGTRSEQRVHMPSLRHVEVADFAPKVWGAACQVHPFMLHAVSQNHRGTARFITNPPIALEEPMCFDRDEHSPVERAVLRALGVERLDYRPAAAREDVVPERVRRQERMREQQEARLAEAAS
jgi:hypothetical protein